MATAIKRRGPRNWTTDEWFQILATVDELPGSFIIKRKVYGDSQPIRRSRFWHAFLCIARDTRLSARRILALRKAQLAPNGTMVVSFANPPRDVVVRLKPDALAAVKLADVYTQRLLDFPYRREQSFSVHWRRILKFAGIEPDSLWPAEVRKATVQPTDIVEPVPEGEVPKTLYQFYESYYRPLRLRGRSTRTDDLYRFTIKNFGRYLAYSATMADLNDRTVSSLLEWMRSRGLSPHSVNKERDQLLAMWRFACLHHFVKTYPNVQKEILPERAPVAWLMTEVRTLFASLKNLPGKIGNVPSPLFWRGLLLVLYDTGERIRAVMQLKRSDFDLENGFVLIPAEYRKGRRRDKLSKLRPSTIETVKAIGEAKALSSGKDDVVFYWPYCNLGYLYVRYADVLTRAGLPTDHKSKFHRIRRTVASYYEKAGGDAMKLLDHTSRCVTAKYLDPRLVEIDHACDLLPDPLSGEGTVTLCALTDAKR